MAGLAHCGSLAAEPPWPLKRLPNRLGACGPARLARRSKSCTASGPQPPYVVNTMAESSQSVDRCPPTVLVGYRSCFSVSRDLNVVGAALPFAVQGWKQWVS